MSRTYYIVDTDGNRSNEAKLTIGGSVTELLRCNSTNEEKL